MKHFYIKSLILAVLIALVFGVCFRFVKGTESNMADSATNAVVKSARTSTLDSGA